MKMFMVNIEGEQRLYTAESVKDLVGIIYEECEKGDFVELGELGKLNTREGGSRYVENPSTGMIHVIIGIEFAVKQVQPILKNDLPPNTPYWEPGSPDFEVFRGPGEYNPPVYRLTWEQFQRGYA